jgi:sialic acid synthase SpsE
MEIIAECGVNFDTVDQAFEMIEKSMEAGCSYAKFQLYDESVIKDSPLQAELWKRMIKREFAEKLFDAGKDIGQPVIFTPMFPEAVDWIIDMGCPLIKIRFADRYNIELVNRAKETGKPVLMSVDRDFKDLYLASHAQTMFMYCVPKYPADVRDYVLSPIDFSARLFAGVSDHTKGTAVMARALECGAAFCEVHVMLEGTHPIEEQWSKTFDEVRTFQQS